MAADFAPSVKFWSNAEVVLSTPLSQLAATVEGCNRSLKALNDSSTQTVVGSAKEYQLYCEAALVSGWEEEEVGCVQGYGSVGNCGVRWGVGIREV